MKHKRFTLMFLDGEELAVDIPDGFDYIFEAKEWCDRNGIPYEILSITEWDLGTMAADGLPEIVAIVNFDAPITDDQVDLTTYIRY